MKGYELSFEDFHYLIGLISRNHAKDLASWINCTAHTRKGSIYFKDNNGNEIPLSYIHNICQADDKLQRLVYNLFMGYAR
jgi:hypothetical protein